MCMLSNDTTSRHQASAADRTGLRRRETVQDSSRSAHSAAAAACDLPPCSPRFEVRLLPRTVGILVARFASARGLCVRALGEPV